MVKNIFQRKKSGSTYEKQKARIVSENDDLNSFDKNTVIAASNGLFVKHENKMFDSVLKSNAEIPEISPSVKLKIEKIPEKEFNRVIAFFRHVYDKHDSEAVVLIYYNFKTGEYLFDAPEQEVAPATLSYKNAKHYKGFRMIGSMHSHCEMSAFHSSTDNEDEFAFDGLHITVGKIKSGPEYAVRFIDNGSYVDVDDIGFVVGSEAEKPEVPKEWIENVDKKSNKISTFFNCTYNRDKNTSHRKIEDYTFGDNNEVPEIIFLDDYGVQFRRGKKLYYTCWEKTPEDVYDVMDDYNYSYSDNAMEYVR